MPKDLYVKIYLDYNEKGYIIADVKFCYGNVEFNPIKNVNLEITRNAIQENEVLDTFVQTGFMLDSANARLVLANDEKIYNFLSKEIEDYMKNLKSWLQKTSKKGHKKNKNKINRSKNRKQFIRHKLGRF